MFELSDITGRKIRRTDERRKHIERGHPEMIGQEMRLEERLRDPDKVYYDRVGDAYDYYRFFKRTPVTDKPLFVCLKYKNGAGFIITSFFTRKIRTKSRKVVYER